MEIAFFRPIYRRPLLTQLLVTFAFVLIIAGVIRQVYGAADAHRPGPALPQRRHRRAQRRDPQVPVLLDGERDRRGRRALGDALPDRARPHDPRSRVRPRAARSLGRQRPRPLHHGIRDRGVLRGPRRSIDDAPGLGGPRPCGRHDHPCLRGRGDRRAPSCREHSSPRSSSGSPRPSASSGCRPPPSRSSSRCSLSCSPCVHRGSWGTRHDDGRPGRLPGPRQAPTRQFRQAHQSAQLAPATYQAAQKPLFVVSFAMISFIGVIPLFAGPGDTLLAQQACTSACSRSA